MASGERDQPLQAMHVHSPRNVKARSAATTKPNPPLRQSATAATDTDYKAHPTADAAPKTVLLLAPDMQPGAVPGPEHRHPAAAAAASGDGLAGMDVDNGDTQCRLQAQARQLQGELVAQGELFDARERELADRVAVLQARLRAEEQRSRLRAGDAEAARDASARLENELSGTRRRLSSVAGALRHARRALQEERGHAGSTSRENARLAREAEALRRALAGSGSPAGGENEQRLVPGGNKGGKPAAVLGEEAEAELRRLQDLLDEAEAQLKDARRESQANARRAELALAFRSTTLRLCGGSPPLSPFRPSAARDGVPPLPILGDPEPGEGPDRLADLSLAEELALLGPDTSVPGGEGEEKPWRRFMLPDFLSASTPARPRPERIANVAAAETPLAPPAPLPAGLAPPLAARLASLLATAGVQGGLQAVALRSLARGLGLCGRGAGDRERLAASLELLALCLLRGCGEAAPLRAHLGPALQALLVAEVVPGLTRVLQFFRDSPPLFLAAGTLLEGIIVASRQPAAAGTVPPAPLLPAGGAEAGKLRKLHALLMRRRDLEQQLAVAPDADGLCHIQTQQQQQEDNQQHKQLLQEQQHTRHGEQPLASSSCMEPSAHKKTLEVHANRSVSAHAYSRRGRNPLRQLSLSSAVASAMSNCMCACCIVAQFLTTPLPPKCTRPTPRYLQALEKLLLVVTLAPADGENPPATL